MYYQMLGTVYFDKLFMEIIILFNVKGLNCYSYTIWIFHEYCANKVIKHNLLPVAADPCPCLHDLFFVRNRFMENGDSARHYVE